MQRTISEDLKVWKDSALRKPLLVRGARQVGKTFVLRELGKNYSHFLEANFEESREIHQFFEGSLKMLKRASPEKPLDQAFHKRLLDALKVYLLIGGMPEVVRAYCDTRDLRACQEILSDLLTTSKKTSPNTKRRLQRCS